MKAIIDPMPFEWSSTNFTKGIQLADRKVTSGDIETYLERRFSDPQKYVAIKQLRCGTGFHADADRYLDYWVLCCYQSDHFRRYTYEVKVSRSDYLREVKNPVKRRMGLNLSNFFFFITPLGLLQIEEIPPECGLVEVFWRREDEETCRLAGQITVPAPHRDPNFYSWKFVAQLGRQLNRRCVREKEE